MLTVEVHLGHLENTARHKTFHRELEQMRHVLSVNGLILVAAVIGLGALAQSAPAGAAEEAEFTISQDYTIAGRFNGKASAIIRLKPLEKGTYKFVGEYNEETAKGTIIAE